MNRYPGKTIIAAVEDDRGRVIVPAIDVGAGRLANGQDVRTFYDRGRDCGYEDPDHLAHCALAQVARMNARSE